MEALRIFKASLKSGAFVLRYTPTFKFSKESKELSNNESEEQFTPEEERKMMDELRASISAVEEIKNLETVAEQRELTVEKLSQLIMSRKRELEQISQETEAPRDAKIFLAIFTAPLLLGGAALNYFFYAGLFTDDLYRLTVNYIKYLTLHTCFMSGIHWGFSMSMHDIQLDSIKSSPEARTHFIKGLDHAVVEEQMGPKWFFNIKRWITLVSMLGTFSVVYLYSKYEKELSGKNYDPLRSYAPTKEELLRDTLKLTEVKEVK